MCIVIPQAARVRTTAPARWGRGSKALPNQAPTCRASLQPGMWKGQQKRLRYEPQLGCPKLCVLREVPISELQLLRLSSELDNPATLQVCYPADC